jgi:hypothetical protein
MCRNFARPKSRIPYLAFLRDKDIRRFNVAMDDALPVCSVQSICNLDRDVKQFTGF